MLRPAGQRGNGCWWPALISGLRRPLRARDLCGPSGVAGLAVPCRLRLAHQPAHSPALMGREPRLRCLGSGARGPGRRWSGFPNGCGRRNRTGPAGYEPAVLPLHHTAIDRCSQRIPWAAAGKMGSARRGRFHAPAAMHSRGLLRPNVRFFGRGNRGGMALRCLLLLVACLGREAVGGVWVDVGAELVRCNRPVQSSTHGKYAISGNASPISGCLLGDARKPGKGRAVGK